MHPLPHHYGGHAQVPKKAAAFTKIFRWEPARPEDPPPASVAVIGTFTNWQPVPLKKDRTGPVWQLMLHGLPGNCTHHYMLLVDGRPAKDPHADGMAVPATEGEKAWALTTPRGPRLFMLFSQTK
jgi:hypothetical protein